MPMVHLWRDTKERGKESLMGLTLAAPSIIGTLKSLSFSQRLLAISVGPTFSTAFRDKGLCQLYISEAQGWGEEERKKTTGR